MYIPKLKLDNTKEEQYFKILSEVHEVRDEVFVFKNKKNMILEAWDVIFATFNFMFKIATRKEIIQGYKDTVAKIKGRHDKGDIVVDEYVEL